MTKTAAPAAIANPCLCGTFEVVTREWEGEGGQPEMDTITTGCTATTRREFSPGHDATLKSLLIRAGVNGWDVRRDMGGVTHISDAVKAAEGFGFAHMVRDGIQRGAAKAAAKTERKQAKTDRPARVRKAAPAPAADAQTATAKVQIKIGRWSYDATIDSNGDAHYTTGKGTDGTAVQGTYKLA